VSLIHSLRLVEYSPEKAGVGGSTPSLATMFFRSGPETWVTVPTENSILLKKGSGASGRQEGTRFVGLLGFCPHCWAHEFSAA